MDFTLVEGPESEPITVAEAKMHLRVDGTDEDAYIGALVGAARRWIERTSGLSLVSQTFDGSLDAFPWDGVIRVHKYPLRSVTSITYHNEDLTTSTVLPAASYQVDTAKRPPLIALKSGASWPTASLRATSGVVVRFVAGYGTAEDVPEDIRHALKLLVAQMYAYREPEVIGTVVARVQFAVGALLADHRLY
jgi:uncharacterized phiE125 gp8 family phage protein